MSNLYRSKEWRKQLDMMIEQQGVDLEYVADYIGAPYNGKETVFYSKLPRKRSRFIGIGMALGQSLDTINEWIRDYSNNHTLYVKDVAEDLVWIYLIRLNEKHYNNGVNYYQKFEECQEAVLITYHQLWDEINMDSLDTSELEIELQKTSYDETFVGLKRFIVDHMDSFKSAYMKPRKLLDRYIDRILKPYGCDADQRKTLNSLRGYLDDSMINYLSGDSETIHTMDKKKPIRMVGFKQVPKNRKTHISLCLALGMTRDEVDRYLEMMGYAPLKQEREEKTLIEVLDFWESKRPIQREYKKACIDHDEPASLSPEEKRQAIQEMLHLRRDLQYEYKRRGIVFPYG